MVSIGVLVATVLGLVFVGVFVAWFVGIDCDYRGWKRGFAAAEKICEPGIDRLRVALADKEKQIVRTIAERDAALAKLAAMPLSEDDLAMCLREDGLACPRCGTVIDFDSTDDIGFEGDARFPSQDAACPCGQRWRIIYGVSGPGSIREIRDKAGA